MKSLEEFVELFAEQMDDTPAGEITAQTRFRDLEEWSSIMGLSIILMASEEFDVGLKGDDIMASNTVEDIYNKIKEKLQ